MGKKPITLEHIVEKFITSNASSLLTKTQVSMQAKVFKPSKWKNPTHPNPRIVHQIAHASKPIPNALDCKKARI
jgi:hypothetical protein